MKGDRAIVWFQQDLRVADNPALFQAIEDEKSVIPVYVWSPDHEGDWPPGAASQWWLHYSLKHLQEKLKKSGLKLIIRSGDPARVLPDLADTAGATHLYWNARYEPHASQRRDHLLKVLTRRNIEAHLFDGNLLFPPGSIKTATGTPYKVFTPFWKSCLEKLETTPPLPAPTVKQQEDPDLSTLEIDDLNLLPEPDWAHGFKKVWTPGETGAHEVLSHFVDSLIDKYPDNRDVPATRGTSRLSPHLHFGEISPRQIHFHVQASIDESSGQAGSSAGAFLRQIGWREFSYHLLTAFPKTTTEPLYEKFRDFPWNDDKDALKKWQRGETGFPLVDAGMRELWATGWMHNRVRMLAASFLVKDLRIHWLEGAKWFWDTLVDADLANNSMGWQWCAGTGADASPFFRIFNPVTQSQKFDKDGEYIRKWIPELSNLKDRSIHEPWKLSEDELRKASSTDKCYPRPIVNHKEARRLALDAYSKL